MGQAHKDGVTVEVFFCIPLRKPSHTLPGDHTMPSALTPMDLSSYHWASDLNLDASWALQFRGVGRIPLTLLTPSLHCVPNPSHSRVPELDTWTRPSGFPLPSLLCDCVAIA